jgi:hypothetical protein
MAHKDRWNTNTLIEILLGAADLVGRSPYPLVEAAERLGFDFESKAFEQAKIHRDRARAALRIIDGCEVGPKQRQALHEAAGMLQTGQWP